MLLGLGKSSTRVPQRRGSLPMGLRKGVARTVPVGRGTRWGGREATVQITNGTVQSQHHGRDSKESVQPGGCQGSAGKPLGLVPY